MIKMNKTRSLKFFIRICPVILAAILLSCGNSSELTEKEKEVIRHEVRQTLQNYYDDIRQSGLLAEFNYLEESPDFFWSPPGFTHPLSYDSIASIIRLNSTLYQKVDNQFDTLLIIPVKRKVATYSGRLTSTVVDTAGVTTTIRMIETGVLIKIDDQWKLLNGQTSVINQ